MGSRVPKFPTNPATPPARFDAWSIDDALNRLPNPSTNDLGGINKILPGQGAHMSPPPMAATVEHYILEKDEPFVRGVYTKFARVHWTLNSPPYDLLGFHVEAAGSPEGPWKRLTKNPVAWWERDYITQGVGIARSGGWSGHTHCLSYRVITVDRGGNESQPKESSNNPVAEVCPTTPSAPLSLRASTEQTAQGAKVIRLNWAPPADPILPAEYYVYRMIININMPFFYDTQVVSDGTTSYLETGGDTGTPQTPPPDAACPYNRTANTDFCAIDFLEAYYVTARYAIGGESPRSNVVFWDVIDPDGYAQLWNGNTSFDAIASIERQIPPETLACWRTDVAVGPDGNVDPMETRFNGRSPLRLLTAPMIRLGAGPGSNPDPPWTVYDLHSDHLGSVRAVTNGSGVLVSRHDYFPFGDEITDQDSYNTHDYTGHERDRETGMDYMLGRYFGAATGRFLSADSGVAISPALVQRWNRYSYAQNSPLTRWDPDGHADVGIESNRVVYGVWMDALVIMARLGWGSPAPAQVTHLVTGVDDDCAGAAACADVGRGIVKIAIENPVMKNLISDSQGEGGLPFKAIFGAIMSHEKAHIDGSLYADVDLKQPWQLANFIKGHRVFVEQLEGAIKNLKGLTAVDIRRLRNEIAAYNRQISDAEAMMRIGSAINHRRNDGTSLYYVGPYGDAVGHGEGSLFHVGVYYNGVPQ